MKSFIIGHIGRTLYLMVILAFLPAFAITIATDMLRLREDIDEAQSMAAEAVNNISLQQNLMFSSARSMLLSLAQVDVIRQKNVAATSELLSSILSLNEKQFVNIFLTDTRGLVISAALPELNGKDLGRADFIMDVRQNRTFSIGGYAESYVTHTPTLYCGFPVFSKEGQFTAILVAGIRIEQDHFRLDELRNISGVKIVATDSAGIIALSHPPDYARLGNSITKERWYFISGSTKDQGLGIFQTGTPREHILAFQRLRMEDSSAPYMHVILGVSTKDAYAALYARMRSKITVLGIAALTGLGVAWVLGQLSLGRPTHMMVHAVRQLEGGDLSARTNITGVGGEMGVLTKAFDQMAETMEIREEELTQAKQAADAANRIKSEFLANMSHEIRTPMNSIIGISYIALKSEKNSRQRTYLRKIYESGNALLGIINSILDFSKIEAGQMYLEHTPFHLDEVLNNVSSMVSYDAQKKNLEVIFAISPDVPRRLKGDPMRLGQILINLVSNAIKFTHQGEIIVSCAAVPARDLGDNICGLHFVVQDTGIGMDEATIDKLFTPFTQADGSVTRKYGGTGLGLAIIKRLVEMMNGKVSISSSLGKGSSVSFTAYLEKDEESAARQLAEQIKNLRVLYVDDSASARKALGDMLAGIGFNASVCASAREAFAVLTEADKSGRPYQLVLLDRNMPDLDGIQAARHIHGELELGTKPQIILATTFDDAEVKLSDEHTGIGGLLYKPINSSQLLDSIMLVMGVTSPEDDRAASGDIGECNAFLSGVKLLLAEDNMANTELAVTILEDVGAQVDTAVNGKQALDMLDEAPDKYDLVLMDLQMPVMDGFEATRRIRTQARFNALPVIAMTAHAMDSEKQACLEAGMNDHVSKPIEIKKFFATLASWLNRPAHVPCGPEPVAPEQAETADQTTQAAQDSQKLPELPGLNLAEALPRLGYNKLLLLTFIRQFRRQHGQDAQKLREAMEYGDTRQAIRIAHTLKGLALSLGAPLLSEHSARLEHALSYNLPEAQELAPPVLDSLAALFAMLDKTLPPDPALDGDQSGDSDDETAQSAASLNHEALEALNELRGLLKDDDASAPFFLREHLQTLSAGVNGNALRALQKSVESYDYALALNQIDAALRKNG